MVVSGVSVIDNDILYSRTLFLHPEFISGSVPGTCHTRARTIFSTPNHVRR